VTHSPTFHARQARGFDQTLAKAERQLAALATRLARGHTRRPRAQVEAEISQITDPRWVSRVLQVTLTGTRPATLRLSWQTNQQARRRWKRSTSASGSCSPTATTGPPPR